MSAFFLAFLAIALAMVAGREAVRVSRMVAAGASPVAMFAIVACVGIAACALAAWLAQAFAALLLDRQQGWFVAAALVLAAMEVIFLAPPKAPREATQSFGALVLVLFAGVLADASGLLILSLSIATGEPVFVAAGGALAVAGVLGAAVLAGPDWDKLPRRSLRWIIATLLLAGAALIVFT
ncbi:hypothetical protein [Erythrobacter alti]|uniref:hypothetical protein n=1 Tax=Erythrobacter alti TaxID=1896145 RepID=UPI0030F43DE6